ncbi:unnamed protein product [Choristocarpus tenellus]
MSFVQPLHFQSRVVLTRRPCRSPWSLHPSSSCQRKDVWRIGMSGFDKERMVDRLEHDMKADLALLAQKFSTLIVSIDDIEEVHVADIDGDHMSLDVMYCEQGEQTCVAVAVPIVFPYHCDTEDCLVDAIHEMEDMESSDIDMEESYRLSKKPISPELAEIIARISVVMNRDFQDELMSFVRVFGGVGDNVPIGKCEMRELTPDGFLVYGALLDSPVRVSFSIECLSAVDFQEQILMLSKEAMMRW